MNKRKGSFKVQRENPDLFVKPIEQECIEKNETSERIEILADTEVTRKK